MHIVLTLLGSIVTILWILHRLAEMGIDLGGLNPWLWRRRRAWRSTYEANPIFSIEDPMEATALLITAVAKADGDMSAGEKQEVLAIFEEVFGLSKRDAAGLLISSTHLLGKGEEVRDTPAAVMKPSLGTFTAAQAGSAVTLMQRIAETDGPPSELQRELVAAAGKLFQRDTASGTTWGEAT